jgi:hypothetical protein
LVESVEVTGTTLFNGGLVHSVKDQIYRGAATLGVDNSLISNTGNIRLLSTTDGAKNLGVFREARHHSARRRRRRHDTAHVAGIGRRAADRDQRRARHATSDITMNADGQASVPNIATIAAPDRDLLIKSDTGDFLVGPNEKLTNIGALTIDVAGTATVGDLNSFGDMTVTASAIKIRLRDPSVILEFLGGIETDTRCRLRNRRAVFFSVAPTTIAWAAPRCSARPMPAATPSVRSALSTSSKPPADGGQVPVRPIILDLRPVPLGGTTGGDVTGGSTTAARPAPRQRVGRRLERKPRAAKRPAVLQPRTMERKPPAVRPLVEQRH